MCGVFGVAPSSEDKLIERYSISKHPKSMGGLLGYKKLPTDLIATISDGEIVPRKWWFIPAWASRSDDHSFSAFNARSETLNEKPVYRDAWTKGQRCIIPVSFFVEWKKALDSENKIYKQPCLIKPTEGDFFSLAGVYETWKGKRGEKLETCSIITTEPNELIRKVHDRMPVIIEKKDEELWLSKNIDSSDIKKLLVPKLKNHMEMLEIDREYAKKKSEEITETMFLCMV